MQTLQETDREVKTTMAFVVITQAQRTEAAWQLGHQAGQAGQLPRGSELYEICSQEWEAYAQGYEAGRAQYSGPAANPYPKFKTAADRTEFLVLIAY